ncbi:hypothetical protein M758_2G102200 [Ceratodon purpureus]|nr:hypothetical protein M758_2G102200 [Ceratodon purpureus]
MPPRSTHLAYPGLCKDFTFRKIFRAKVDGSDSLARRMVVAELGGDHSLGGCRWIFAGVYLHSQHGNLSTGFGSVHCWHPGRTASIATTNEDCRVSRNLQENR